MSKIVVGVDGWGRPRRILDESGNQYGRLTVLHVAESSNDKKIRWVCSCSWGKTTIVLGALLRFGATTSCGCYWNEIRISGCHRLPKGEAAFNRVYGKIKNGATKRGLPWELSKDDVKQFITSACHYCGCLPANLHKEKYGSLTWNGVDQKIPGAGYTIENCVPCCYECNRMKLNIPYDRFTEKVFQMATNLAKQSDNLMKGR